MAVDGSFHKNVSLLMQVVPASFECTKHFKKGMFDKPNTSGFIYVSHYLLSVYNAKEFQKMVTWPIMNKMDEKKYRTEIKDYLEIVASKNPDINLLPILMSHLVRAGGTKFLIFMWKLSQISLRAYMARECQMKLLNCPNFGDNKDVIQTYFTTMNVKKDISISLLYRKMKLVLENFNHYMQCKFDDLKSMQSSIFEIKENIQRLIPTLPVSPLIATRLGDIDDTEIINLWKGSIDETIQTLNKENLYLRKLKTLSSTLHDLILDSREHSKFLCGNELPQINSELLSSYLTSNNQLCNFALYENGHLVLHVLLSVLKQAFRQLESDLQMNGVPDLSNCEPKVIEHCELIKSMEETFQKFVVQVSDNLCEVSCNLQDKIINCSMDSDFLNPICLETVLTSPKHNLSFTEYIHDDKLSRRIIVTPTQGKYKHLFQRHKRNYMDSPIRTMAKYHNDDSIESMTTNYKSPIRQSFLYKRNSPNKIQVSPRYSRLFSTIDSKRSYFKDNNAASTPNQSQRSKTPKKSNVEKQSACIVNIDVAMKNIFELSCKISDAVASLSKS